MKRLLLGIALSTFCLAGSACNTTRVAVPLKPDPARMDCVAVEPGQRPAIPPEYVIDWTKVTTIDRAKSEHDAYVRSVRAREGVTVEELTATTQAAMLAWDALADLRRS